MITNISLKNWRSHTDTSLAFASGTNLLVGRMGSGKTSVLDAICFALYGTFPSLKQKKLKTTQLIQNRPSQKEKAEITMKFSFADKSYEVKRIIPKDGVAEASLRDDSSKIIEFGPTQVTAYIEKLLQTDYDLFVRAIYSVQNRIDYFLLLQKGERKREIDETLGLDRFENVRKNLNKVINKLSEKNKENRAMLIQFDIETIRKEKETIESDLIAINISLDETKEKFDVLSKSIVAKRENLDLQLKKKERNDFLNNEIAKIEGEIERIRKISAEKKKLFSTGIDESLVKSISSLLKKEKETIQKLENEKASIDSSLIYLKKEELRLAGEIKSIEGFLAKNKIGEQDVSDLENEKIALEKELQNLKSDLDKLQSANIEKNGETSALTSDLLRFKNLKTKKEVISIRRNNLLLQFKSLDLVKQKITALENEINDLTKNKSNFEAKIEDLELTIQQLKKTDCHCPLCESHISEDKKEALLKGKSDEISSLIAKAELIPKQLKTIENELSSLKKIENEVVELQTTVTNIDAELEPIKNVEVRVEAAINEINILRKKLTAAKEHLTSKESRFSEISDILSKLGASIAKQQSLVDNTLRLREINNSIFENDKKLKEIVSQLEKIDKTKIESDENKLQNAIEFLNLQKQLPEILQKRESFSDERNSLAFNPKDSEKLQLQLQEILVSQGDLKAKISALQTDKNAKDVRLSQLSRMILNASEREKEISKIEKAVEFSQKFQNAVIATQASLRSHLISTINLAMSQLWPTIYVYPNYAGIRLESTDDDYSLQLKAGEEWVEVDGIASGGERSCACLTLRIALAMALAPSLSWIILDEPTHNLDAEGVKALAKALHDKIPQIVSQVFVITHDDDLKEATTGVVYTFKKNENNLCSVVSENGDFA